VDEIVRLAERHKNSGHVSQSCVCAARRPDELHA
jgi:hypothetical protein